MPIHNVAQNSPEWFNLRAGKPSASMFGNIITEKALLKSELLEKLEGYTEHTSKLKVTDLIGKCIAFGIDYSPNLVMSATDYAEQLASECLGGWMVDDWLPDLTNVNMKHGHDSERPAVKFYEEETGRKCEQVGFVTDESDRYGCSPDRFVLEENGLVEIKAPLGKNVIKYWMEYLKTGDCPKDFKFQVQGQMMITERDWCDLILFHPQPQLRKIIRVEPDLAIQRKLKEQIELLLEKRDAMVVEMQGF